MMKTSGASPILSLTLASLAFMKKPFEIICAMQIFSYAVPLLSQEGSDKIKYVARKA
jgi:hypothetical protein